MKKTFKDFLRQDLKEVFFNTSEFATTVFFEGEPVDIILDDDTMKNQQLQKGISELHNEELLFYVIRKDLSFYPRPDNVLNYDDCKWVVKEVSEDLGMLTVRAIRFSG